MYQFCGNPKVFKPAPLNSINTLTIKIKDNIGNQLKFRDETLSISNIELTDSTGNTDNKFIKITTAEYFSRLNYIEGDIVYFFKNHCRWCNIGPL